MRKNILLLGSPGAGKGTIAKRFIEDNKYTLLTTGDILREEKNSDSELGKLLRETIGSGKLVSDEIINEIVKSKLKSSEPPYLFDGYPRTIPQAEFLKEYAKIDLVIYLEISDEVVINRILERGKTSGRDDDRNISIINKRLEAFKAETQPLFDYYSDEDILYTVNAEQTMDEVYSDFVEHVKYALSSRKFI